MLSEGKGQSPEDRQGRPEALMPLDPQNKAQVLDRELRVWDLRLQGRESVEIRAARASIPRSSRIKTRVSIGSSRRWTGRWRASRPGSSASRERWRFVRRRDVHEPQPDFAELLL